MATTMSAIQSIRRAASWYSLSWSAPAIGLRREFSTELSYLERKKAARDRRRELYELRITRKERLKTRRDGSVKGEKHDKFMSFYQPKTGQESFWNRDSRRAGLDWKINVSVILQRYFILLPDMEKWESDFEELRAHVDKFRKPLWPKEIKVDVPETKRDPVRDKILLDYLFPKGYVHPPSKVTEADLNGDIRTIDRKLTTNVFLMVKEGENTQWHLPTVPLQEGETLLDAGRRAMDERVGPNLEYWCPGAAPMAVDMVALPSEEERTKAGVYGTKTFVMKFVHYSGDLPGPTGPVKDFAWLDKEEIVTEIEKEEGGERPDGKSRFYHYVL